MQPGIQNLDPDDAPYEDVSFTVDSPYEDVSDKDFLEWAALAAEVASHERGKKKRRCQAYLTVVLA